MVLPFFIFYLLIYISTYLLIYLFIFYIYLFFSGHDLFLNEGSRFLNRRHQQVGLSQLD